MATYKKYNFAMPTTTYKPSTYSDNTGAYADDIARARLALDQTQASKPGAYQPQYADRVNNVIGQIQGRKFSYDVNQDAMFQQLKSIYDAQGRAAMSDAMGQAAAMTGGYGNSYAAAVGNQARQQANEQLYSRIPELYQLALARYQQEGNDLQNEYAILSAEDATAYGRHRDTVADYQNELATREAALRSLQGMNQSIWSQDESNAFNANNQAWENYRWGEQQTEANRAQAIAEEQRAAQIAQSAASQALAREQFEYQKQKNDSDSELEYYKSKDRLNSARKALEKEAQTNPQITDDSFETVRKKYNLTDNEVIQLMREMATPKGVVRQPYFR